MMLHTIAVAAVLASAAGPDLSWRWVEGDRRVYTVEAETRQTVVAGDEKNAEPSRTTSTLRFEAVQDVRSVDGNGTATVDQTVGPVEVVVVHPDLGRITADGGDHDPFAGLDRAERQQVEPYVRLGGSAVTFQIGPDGTVRSASGGLGGDAVAAAISQLFDAGGEGGLGGISGGGGATPSHIQQSLALIPNRRVEKGERWSTTIEQPLPLLGTIRTTTECTYAGATRTEFGRVPRIEFEGTMEFGGVSVSGVLQLAVRSGRTAGELTFDPESGQIITLTSTTTMVWTVATSDLLSDTGEAGSQTITLEQRGTWSLTR